MQHRSLLSVIIGVGVHEILPRSRKAPGTLLPTALTPKSMASDPRRTGVVADQPRVARFGFFFAA